MSDPNTSIQELKDKIKEFVKERDWGQYHSPKNLSMSLSVEAAELMEHFQWLTNEQSHQLKNDPVKKSELEDELADIAVYLLNLCNALDVDLSEAIKTKMVQNSAKYPTELVKGKAHKYTHYARKTHQDIP